jgi:hypothetical protein
MKQLLEQLAHPAQLAPLFRLMSTRSRKPPDRTGYVLLLRKLDRFYLHSLRMLGASTWAELKDATRPFGGTHFPTKQTVEDWLAVALRRGLIEQFGDEDDPASKRWALTEEGLSMSQGWMRRLWPVLRAIGAILGSLATLVLGSAVLLGSLDRVEWGSVFGSEAFEISVIVLVYAVILSFFWMASWRYKATLALGAIDMTRLCGDLPGLEVDAGTVAAYSAPPPADSVS